MDKHPIPTTAGSGLRRHRLVSFLGTGRFDKTTGRWFYDTTRHGFPDGAEGPETPYVCRALAQYLTADEITIIATPEARAAHGDGVTTELHSANLPAPVFQSIPKGENGAELWQQFETVKGLLRPPAGTEVALDITHAFRSQPFFAAAVAAFVRAVDPTPAALRIFYAAYEPGKAVTPVWELTPFIDLVDWAQGMMLFLRTGRSEGVAERTIRLGDELERRWAETKQGPQLHLKRLGETLIPT